MVMLQGARVVLRDKRIEDAEQDYIWRSDHELAKLDAAYPLTMSFERYLKMFQDQLKYPTPGSHHFATETLDGKFIGNCMYYDLDSVNLQAELGIVIGDRDYWSNAYGYDAVTTLLEYCFTEKKAQEGLPAHLGVESPGPTVFREMRVCSREAGPAFVPRLYPDGSIARRLARQGGGKAGRTASLCGPGCGP